MQPLSPRSIAAVTYLRDTYTYAAGFSVFDAEPKQHADLCTPRNKGGLQLTLVVYWV